MLLLFTEALSDGLGSLEARCVVTVSSAAVTVNTDALISEVTSSSEVSSTSSTANDAPLQTPTQQVVTPSQNDDEPPF